MIRQMIMIRILFVILMLFGNTAQAEQSNQGFPRSFQNADGTQTVIPAQPKNILSTSVTITGTLIAIDAPVTASATAGDGHFFAQWASHAKARDIKPLWPVGGVDTEMAYTVMPDLIVVAKTGGDSVMDYVDELKLIAPVIVLDYGSQPWQALAQKLGQALGLEDQVALKISEFDRYVDSVHLNIAEPYANVIRYSGPGVANAIAKSTGPHTQLLSALGFRIESTEEEWETFADRRQDFVRVHYETLTQLKAPTSFVIVADRAVADDVMNDVVLANVPSVKRRQVYPLGLNSFRIDYYSSLEIIELLKQEFGVRE